MPMEQPTKSVTVEFGVGTTETTVQTYVERWQDGHRMRRLCHFARLPVGRGDLLGLDSSAVTTWLLDSYLNGESPPAQHWQS